MNKDKQQEEAIQKASKTYYEWLTVQAFTKVQLEQIDRNVEMAKAELELLEEGIEKNVLQPVD